MKKVMQTITGLGGNCEGATIATLLGLDLEQVPDFWDGVDKSDPSCPVQGAIYHDNMNAFLAKHGYKMLSLGVSGSPTDSNIQWVIDISKHLGVKHLVAGKSPRGFMHSVIYENGKLWHDPHPEGGGVIPQQICLLIPIFDDRKSKLIDFLESRKQNYVKE